MGEASLVEKDTHSEPVIRVQSLYKNYRRQVAVRGVSLSICRNEIYGLIGPDGSGKSSLMKIIAGVLSYEAGSVDVFGVRIDSEASAEKVKGRIGFMPQGLGLNLYPELSVEENINFFARLREVSQKQLAERKRTLLAMTRLDAFKDRPMKNLSGGMKQKLGLICTLIHEPELVILDEPTTGVDPVSRRDFWAILAELLRERGITALVSTSYLDEASRFHRLSLMYGGQVLAEGEPNDITRTVPGRVVEVRSRSQMEAFKRLRVWFPQVDIKGEYIRVYVDCAASEEALKQVKSVLSDISTESLQAIEPELEDSFVALLRYRKLVEHTTFVLSDHTPHNSLPDDEVAIEARELTRDFGSFRAVDHVSFCVRQGEIFGLLGANGAGKTTVIKMLTGILSPTEGEGRVAGVDMRRAGRAIKEHIGYMSQAFSLYRDLSVLENINLYARIYGVSRVSIKTRVDWVIQITGLRGMEDTLASDLPLGMRQRLALGCALVHKPRVLFLDEPTSGVDPVGRRVFWDILVHMARVEKVAILVTTHYMSEAEQCDHLVLMHAGRVVADASPAKMKEDLQREVGWLFEISTDRPLEAIKLLEQTGFEGVALFGKKIHLLARDSQEDLSKRIESVFLTSGIRLLDIRLRLPSLEDVFVYRIMAKEKELRE